MQRAELLKVLLVVWALKLFKCMKTRSKRYKSAVTHKSNSESYSTTEAVETLNKFESAKFDESVEISISLALTLSKAHKQLEEL